LLVAIGFGLKEKNFYAFTFKQNNHQINNFCSDLEDYQTDLTSGESVVDRRMSWGEKLLNRNSPEFSQPELTQAVERGINAFAHCEFTTAVTYLDNAFKFYKNNPELLIYLNNAKVAEKPSLKIAVSVPIHSKLAIAQEMLRGVAQAQDEINQEGGINGKLLQVQIANDDNEPEIAQKIATKLVQEPEILAVVGHNSSDASIAASGIYQQGKLVMISPTSVATELSGIGDYIFRTVPDVHALAESLGNYTVKLAGKTKIALCEDSSGAASQSFIKEFSRVIVQNQGTVIRIGCDFALDNFNPQQISFQKLPQQAEALLLAPSVDSISKAIAVAKANQRQIPLLANHAMYTFETLQEGQANVNEMILPVPWLSGSIPRNSFPEKAQAMWGGSVNWRTAMAYDATVAIIQGLKEATTRQGLQAALADQRFAVNGATGQFTFENGDRLGEILLVKVKPANSDQDNHYQFFPIKQE
jgi:branched-chain amino acid transport system substrate-binding protein